MTPVRLRNREVQRTIEEELDNQISAYIALETGRDIPGGHEDALLARLQSIAADIKVHLQKNVELSEDLQKVSDTQQRGERKQRQGSKHIAVEDDTKPSVGPAEDTLALEKEVTELATRIEAHCEEFPQRVAHQLSEHLQRIRPSATSSDPPETDMNLDTRLEPVSGLPSLAELQEKLGGAVTTLLGLQRRLELAEAKASRVVNAVEQERSRGGPSLTEQVIAEHDKVMGYLEDKPRARGTKRAATTSDLGGSPVTRSRSKV